MRSLSAIVTLSLAFLTTANSQLIPNIALNKTTVASAVFGSRVASNAVDGNNQTTNNDLCCTTSPDSSSYAWWRVDLGSVYVVNSITVIISAQGVDGEYLKNCGIYVETTTDDNAQPACVTLGNPSGIPPGGSQTFSCTLVGRYVTIKKLSPNEPITVCEVLVTGYEIVAQSDIALNKPASESSMYYQREARYAVDGNTQTSNNELCATTTAVSNNNFYSWWQVDLGGDYVITSLTVFVSADPVNDGTYMKNCNIYVGSSPSSVTNQPACVSLGNPSGLPAGSSSTFNCTPWLVGRYITIMKTVQNEPITVCEVIASGYWVLVSTTTSTSSITNAATSTSTSTTSTTSTTTTTTTRPTTTSTTTSTTTTTARPISTSTTIASLTSSTSPSTTSTVVSTIITAPMTSTSPTSSATTSSNNSTVVGASSGLTDQQRSGIIAGCIVGFFVLLVIVAIIIFVLMRRGYITQCCESVGQTKKPPSDLPLIKYVTTTEDIPVEQLEDHVKQMKLKGTFETEFKQLPKGDVNETKTGALAANKLKNRFKNVLPFDNNIVPVTSMDGKSDIYINASFIKGHNGAERAYIATQGPKKDTVDDFWLMIWQYDVNRIVMLTRLIENAKAKCEQYWPSAVNEPIVCGDITVCMSVEEEFSDHVFREFRIYTDDERNARIVRHFHFLSFDDKTRPSQLYPLVAFRRKIRTFDSTATGPMIVHCSAGVGRTGTFIAVDYLIDQALEQRKVNVFNCVSQMRHQRGNMVQTEPQYVFLYEALLDGITTGDTAVACNNFASVYADISKSVHGSTISLLEKQYLLLKKLKEVPTDRSSVGLDPVNAVKNRNGNIIAYDESRPRLVTTWKEGNDYINAIFINSFRSKEAYVLTQLPLEWTVVDFWRMIYDYKMPIIVLLDSPIVEEGSQYWPDEPSVSVQGPFDVVLKSDETTQYGTALVAVREFSIRKTNSAESFDVKQFHLLNWPVGRPVPPNSAMLLDLINVVMHCQQQLNAADSKIVMQCTDGAERCGLFATGCYMLDKMRIDQAVDVFISSRFITSQRPKAIDNVDQYRFLHELALTFLTQYEEYANFRR